MPLPKLAATAGQVPVQETAFSIDAVGRFVANTYEEATASGPFSAIVVGAGAFGAYCATEIRRSHPGARVLVLDAGSFLVAEHVQNLGSIGLDVAAPIMPSADPGTAREVVWGLPWRGNVEFPGLAYCTGGKSIYWGGWCPRLTDADLAGWPPSVAAWLNAHYSTVESETGVVPDADFIFGALQSALFSAVTAAATTVPGLTSVQRPPLAVQGSPPVSGLFGFDKFSSVPLLVDAIRRDVRAANGSDAARRLFLVPRAHVVALHTSGGRVDTVEVDVAGVRRFLGVAPGAAVVLAASAIETTRLALHSFPTPLMGRNLMAHVRTDFPIRIARGALPQLPGPVETAAMLVRAEVATGRFHLQLTASTSRGGSDELLFKMIPDIEELATHTAAADPDWIPVTLRGIGEMTGDRTGTVPDPSRSWINLSPFETDEYGVPRAYVHLVAAPGDVATWAAMDAAALQLAQAVAGSPDRIQYFWDGQWRAQPFPADRPSPEWHRGLGTTYHESGTLWMGDDPAASVTNTVGRFHHVSNAYACDQSLFPTVGSANPVLTGLTLAKRVAEALPI
ncbi:MAG TPA: GMC oxidoreductase [Kineosporiaceae bacterium]|nr:GMC oxidoreductase [Kineosporiaceae bacterium]